MDEKISRKSNINIEVALNSDKQPVEINWKAEDAGVSDVRPCKSIMLAVWDETEKSSLRIDLWTTKMMVPEMQQFFYETLSSMAETYRRSTGDDALADELKKFSSDFGKKMMAG